MKPTGLIGAVQQRRSSAALDAGALLLVALFVDLVWLGRTNILFDESSSVVLSHLSVRGLFAALGGSGGNMGLYYFLLKFWVGIFGESEVAVRSLSVLFAALAVPATYLLGARLFGRTAGLLAGLLLALNAFMVEYAQTARSYALLVLLVTLSSLFLVGELERPSRANRLGYVLASACAVYTHYFAALVLLVHFGTVLAIARKGALSRPWLGTAASLLLLCIPEAIVALQKGPADIAWIDRPSLRDIEPLLVALSGGGRILLFLLLTCGLYALASAMRGRRSWYEVFVSAWFLGPLVLSFAASFVQPMFVPHYLIISVPALVLLAAAGVTRIAGMRSWVLVFAATMFAGLSTGNLLDYYRRDRGENWRDAARYILSLQHVDDGIAFYPDGARRPIEYYERRAGATGPTRIDSRAPTRQTRIWLVVRLSDAEARPTELRELQSALSDGYHVDSRRAFRRLGVELYVR